MMQSENYVMTWNYNNKQDGFFVIISSFILNFCLKILWVNFKRLGGSNMYMKFFPSTSKYSLLGET